MSSIFLRGEIYHCKLKSERDVWFQESTRYRFDAPDAEAKAEEYARLRQRQIDKQRIAAGDAPHVPLTVNVWAEQWLEMRREKHEASLRRYRAKGSGKVEHRDHATDEGRMKNHVLPYLGSMLVDDVRPKHLATWIHTLRIKGTLGPHTVRSIYALVVALFRDAAVLGHVENSPAILTAAQLGDDEGSEEGAGRYTREQFARMIGSDQVTEDERIFAALGGLAGLRLGGIAGLRWGDLDTTAAPLGRLTSVRTYDGQPTKSGKSSVIPVHPVLAEMLAAWRHGWERMFGRAPTATDPIVPRPPGKWRDTPGKPHTKKTGGDLMDRILAKLEIPSAPMKAHALRSTFVSIALEDGADPALIERVTHTTKRGRKGAFARYDRADYWPKLCAAVAMIRIPPKSEGRVVPFGAAFGAVVGNDSDSGAIQVEAPGVEGRNRVTADHSVTLTVEEVVMVVSRRDGSRSIAAPSLGAALKQIHDTLASGEPRKALALVEQLQALLEAPALKAVG